MRFALLAIPLAVWSAFYFLDTARDSATRPSVAQPANPSIVAPPANPAIVASPKAPIIRARFARCEGRNRVTCVVDGDTIWLDGEKIRIADIDTPEISQPACPAEALRGERATARLMELLNQSDFELLPNPDGRDEDPYGRKLRVLARDGLSLGDVLLAEGLAHQWGGGRRSWC